MHNDDIITSCKKTSYNYLDLKINNNYRNVDIITRSNELVTKFFMWKNKNITEILLTLILREFFIKESSNLLNQNQVFLTESRRYIHNQIVV